MAYMPLSFKENVSLKFLMNSTGVDVQNGSFIVRSHEKKGAELLAKNNRIYTAALINLMDNGKFLEEMLKSFYPNYGLSYRSFANWFMTQIIKGLESGRISTPKIFTDTLEKASCDIINQNPAEANQLFYLFNREWVTNVVANSVLNELYKIINEVGENKEEVENSKDTFELAKFDLEKLTKWTQDLIDDVVQHNCDTGFVVLLTAAKAMKVEELQEQLLRAAASQIRKYYLMDENMTCKADMGYVDAALLDGLRSFVKVGSIGDFWRLHDKGYDINVPNVIAAYDKFKCNPFGLEYPINIKDVQNISYDDYERALAFCIASANKEDASSKITLFNDPDFRKAVIDAYEGNYLSDYQKDAIALASSLSPEEISDFVLDKKCIYRIGVPYLAYNLEWLPDHQLTDTGFDKKEVLSELKDKKEKTSKAEEDFYYRVEIAKKVINRNDTIREARDRYNALNPLRRAWISAVYNLYKNSGPVMDSREFENLTSQRANNLYYKLGRK